MYTPKGGGNVFEQSSACNRKARKLRIKASHLADISQALRKKSRELRRYNRKFNKTYKQANPEAQPFLVEVLFLSEPSVS